MSFVLEGLVTASVMLTIACGIAALFFRRYEIATPWLRQSILMCVMLQGLMLIRMPIELPWLESHVIQTNTVVTESISDGWSSDLGIAGATGKATESQLLFDGASNSSSLLANGPDRWLPEVASWSQLTIGTALLVWLVGFAVLVVRSGLRYIKLCRLIECLEPAGEAWRSEWQRVCEQGGRSATEMLVSVSSGPMLIRRLRGYTLVVPVDFWNSLSSTQRRGVLLHEFAHLRRHDVWRQLLVRLTAALHWWNPATWWCVRRYEESAEWACDDSLAQDDPAAAQGLASSLVRLVEFFGNTNRDNSQLSSGLGVQSMAAAPLTAAPLTARVTRLLSPLPSGDSAMKRSLFVVLTIGLLTLSMIQFRLIAGDPDSPNAASEKDQAAVASDGTGLQVLSGDMKGRMHQVRERLNSKDKASADLRTLLGSESGQIAVAGLLSELEGKYRDDARAEAVPRFIEMHFETTDDDKLTLRKSSESTSISWVRQSKTLGETLDSMQQRMQSIADRIDQAREVDQMATRMLIDEHAAFAIMLDHFDGQSDPIDLFLKESLAKVLVKRGDKMIVIPTLGAEGRRKIASFELATKVYKKLSNELPAFAKEFATPDERHVGLVKALNQPTMAAIVALHVSKNESASASATVDRLFEQLESATRDTAEGLIIEEEQAWETLQELVDLTDRADKSIDSVKDRLAKIASDIDVTDPASARFASELSTGVIAYQVAAEIPYGDLDLGNQIEAMVSQVMEPTAENKLRVRDDKADEVSQRASEILAACRTIRRHLGRVDSMRDSMTNRELAELLAGPGRMVLFAEVRRSVKENKVPLMEILEQEMFTVDETTHELTVRPDRTQVVDQIARRAKELERELSKDDF